MTDTPLLICGSAFNEEERNRLENAVGAVYVYAPGSIAGLDASVRDAIKAVAFKGHNPFGPDAMDAIAHCGLIANFGVGYDAIDVDAASARSIKVTNTPDVLNDCVADLAVGMMITHARNMIEGDRLVRSGEWAGGTALPLNRKFTGAKVGICGLGRIGRDIADRLAAFKMDIHYHSRAPKDTPGWTFHDDPVSLAQSVDWFVVALVGGAETEKYVSRAVLDAMGPNSVVVNISRGTTIDEAALLDVLENGTIGGACLDVFNDEPTIDPRFHVLENVVLQPHQGSGTVETRRAMAELQLANIKAYLDGEPLKTAVN